MDEANCHLWAVVSDVSEHIAEAFGLSHPFATLRLAGEATSLTAAVAHVAGFLGRPDALRAQRRAIEDALVAAKAAVRPLLARFRACMPSSVFQAAGALDPGLFAACARCIGWPDTTLVECICLGFPVVGVIPPSGCPGFRPVPAPDVPDIAAQPNGVWNRYVVRFLERRFQQADPDLQRRLWERTIEERDERLCFGPYSLAQVSRIYGGEDAWRCMDRFAVLQEKDDGRLKVRCCDNAARSSHNAFTSLSETITCDAADFPARAAALFLEAIGDVPGWSMCGGTDDISSAYRRCGARTPQFTVVAQVDPATGKAVFFLLPGMNFGLAAAVNQFNRLPELVVAFMRSALQPVHPFCRGRPNHLDDLYPPILIP